MRFSFCLRISPPSDLPPVFLATSAGLCLHPHRLAALVGYSRPEIYSCSGNKTESESVLSSRGKKDGRLAEPNMLKRFEEAVLPHLAAAYNLARWLSRNDHDAEDLAQEACLRALKAFDGFRGGDGRAWLLTIVRNTCYIWLRPNRMDDFNVMYDREF